MALFKAKANQSSSVSRVGEGADVYVKALRDGSLTTAAFFQAMAMEGRMYVANAGSVTTPITFGAGDITGTEPDLLVEVPSNMVVIPVSFILNVEAYGTTAIFQCILSAGKGGSRGAATGGTAVTPVNVRTDAPFASQSTIYSNIDTGTATYLTTNAYEFWRDGLQKAVTQAAADATSPHRLETFAWSAQATGTYPILVGASQLFAFAAGQAGTGFMTLTYVELPVSAIV
jgi:hypothetical protein